MGESKGRRKWVSEGVTAIKLGKVQFAETHCWPDQGQWQVAVGPGGRTVLSPRELEPPRARGREEGRDRLIYPLLLSCRNRGAGRSCHHHGAVTWAGTAHTRAQAWVHLIIRNGSH